MANTFRNKVEMKLLGYTVYSDKENWNTTFDRMLKKLLYPIKKHLGIGFCAECGKFNFGNRKQVIDWEVDYDQDGPTGYPIYGYVCENCDWIIEEGKGGAYA
jgi:hypothetical protein